MKDKLIVARRITQTFFLFLFLYILWSTTFPLKGTMQADTFFNADPLINIFTSISEKVLLPGLGFSFVMLGLTLLLGRFFCGWICPLGATMDFMAILRKSKDNFTLKLSQKLKPIKFFILGAIACLSLVGLQLAWVLDPMVIMARFISLNFIPTITLLCDKFLVSVILKLNRPEMLLDLYRGLKESFLGVKISYFSHAWLVFVFFMFVVLTAWIARRFWCRFIGPLGALYAATAKFSLLERQVTDCVFCGKCKSKCRMAAINEDLSYDKKECILCMDCVYECPQNITKFSFPEKIKKLWARLKEKNTLAEEKGITRREFLTYLILSASPFALGLKRLGKTQQIDNFIRPPAALKEDKFLDRCIRCGNCMKVCPTNGLQPLMLQKGVEGIWTPHLVPRIGYCEYNCNLCGNVCPTGAIPKLSVRKKQKTKIGIAKIDKNLCRPWAKKKECIVCEEVCPVPDKAIKLKKKRVGRKTVMQPQVDSDLCIGCGICETKCPIGPVRAIKILPVHADRE